MNKMRRGFTMIELIFVIVIIGILAAVAIPKLAATSVDARASSVKATLATASGAVPAYYLGQRVAGLTPSMTLDTKMWVLSNSDCTATFTDPAGDKVVMAIVEDTNTAPAVTCASPGTQNTTDTNLSMTYTYTVAGHDAVEQLTTSLGMANTRIPLGSKGVLRN